MAVRENVKLVGRFYQKYAAGKKFTVRKPNNNDGTDVMDNVSSDKFNTSGFDWISLLSHELRTPLNVILSTIQIAQMPVKEACDSEYRQVKSKYLSIMKQNCLRLLKMVNNMIDINRIDSSFFQIDPANENIVRIVNDITLSVSEYAQMKNISVSFSSNRKEHIISCDGFQLERILLNLLSNAIKFTPVGGKIDVKVTVMPEKVYISVSDSGPGIPEKYQKSIFERFGQTDGKSFLEKKGSGMGLFLVKKLLEKMNGSIWLSSKMGQGSTFTFLLPNCRLPSGINETRRKEYESNRVEYLQIEFSDIYVK